MRTFLESCQGWQAGNILDVRPFSEFRKGHLKGATHHQLDDVNELPVHKLDLDHLLPSIFLPPRHEAMLVVAGQSDQASHIARELEKRGRTTVDSLGWAGRQCPAEFKQTGDSKNHLWSPPPWLVQYEDWLPPPSAGPVLDLACGSGRAVVYLAERGYRTLGIDWQDEALEMGRTLARSRSVSCEFISGDLRDLKQIPAGPWSVILNFRYLERGLLAHLPKMLQPSGVAMVRTFRQVAGYNGHPRPIHRLAPGELIQAFPKHEFDIIASEEGHDPDGRPAAGIVVRRKAI
ncbi:MAG: methyltransferase domain-containing protein [bacterium]|nr:methyltransferase domain-containing protein [bacterium]